MKYIVSLSIMLILCSVSAFAQTYLRGIVIDSASGEPIADANITIKGWKKITSSYTNRDGAFRALIEYNGELMISADGYETKRINFTNHNKVNDRYVVQLSKAVPIEVKIDQ